MAGRARAAGPEPLHAAAGRRRPAGVHRRGPGDRPPGQQVRPQGEAARDRLVPLVRSHQGRGRDAPARHAPHERHRRDRRAEHVRRRRALRHRGPAAGGDPPAGPQPQHPRRRLLQLDRRQRLRLPRRTAPTPTTWAATPRTCSAWSGSRRRARSSAPARSARATAGSAARAPARPCAASAGARSAAAGASASTPSAPSSSPRTSARPSGTSRARCRRTACPCTRTCASTRSPCPTGTPGRTIYYKIYDNEIGYIFHRQFNLAGADLAPAFWLMYNDATKTLSDVPELVADPEIAEADRGAAHQLPAHPRRAVEGRHRAAGQDPRRHPRGGRRLEGRALLRAGHGRVHQHVPAAARPQAHQLRLGRRLHRQLDAVRHAGLGQGLRARRPPRASSATPPAASSCSAAATR